MFTGIIEHLGRVKEIGRKGRVTQLKIQSKKISKGLKCGESVSLNGACMTLTQTKGSVLSFDIQNESLRCTTLGELRVGDKVHLERALSLNSRLNGHIVQGHVDAVGKLRALKQTKEDVILTIQVPTKLLPYIVPKGSIAVNGVSLTVVDVWKDSFSVHLIPHTLKETHFDQLKKGDKVNLEVDVLAKYIERILSYSDWNGRANKKS